MKIIIYKEILAITHAEGKLKQLVDRKGDIGEALKLSFQINGMYHELLEKIDNTCNKEVPVPKLLQTYKEMAIQKLETNDDRVRQ